MPHTNYETNWKLLLSNTLKCHGLFPLHFFSLSLALIGCINVKWNHFSFRTPFDPKQKESGKERFSALKIPPVLSNAENRPLNLQTRQICQVGQMHNGTLPVHQLIYNRLTNSSRHHHHHHHFNEMLCDNRVLFRM